MGRGEDDRRALACMLAFVLTYSLAALAIASGGGARAPFTFAASWRAGTVPVVAALLMWRHRQIIRDPGSLRAIGRHALHWTMLASLPASINLALFAWSTRHIDVPTATVTVETWPVLFIILMYLLTRRTGTHRRNTPAGSSREPSQPSRASSW